MKYNTKLEDNVDVFIETECTYLDWDTALLLNKFYLWLKEKEGCE